MTQRTSVLLFMLALALVLPLQIAAAERENNPVRATPTRTSDEAAATERLIVKFRAPQTGARMQAQSVSAENRASALAQRMSLRLKTTSAIADRMQAMQIDLTPGGETAAQVMERLRNDAEVEYVQVDRRRHPHAVPSDPLYVNQWYLQSQAATPSAIRADQAWDVTTGSASVVIAILDTGVRFDHPDLQAAAAGGRLLPGYDFVSNVAVANDGDGRDADPSDPGDWVSSADTSQSQFSDCDVSGSSWHGTRVAGILGAKTNNAQGVAGTTWTSPLLPVRVLGKCGGFDTDIIAGMLWAGGIPVSGVPNNPNPAKIINMSLGGDGACSPAYRDAVNQLTARGVLVVASAGNDAGHAVSEPADCPGVMGVAALRHIGTKVGFSNMGPEISISAPGGNCVNLSGACLYSLDTTYNLGATVPTTSGYTNQFVTNLGTSFSAPIAAGVAALVRSVNSNLTPAQTIVRLQQSATPFPVSTDTSVVACQNPDTVGGDQLECNCTTSTCGAGMVNAAAAVAAAQRPYVTASASPTSPANGQTVTLSGSSFAADGRTITTYAWSVVSSGGATPAIAGANLANASFTAPSAGTIVLRLTVTDSAGSQDSADVTVTTPAVATTPAPPATPASASTGGGGGGGAFFLLDLVVLLTLLGRRRYA